MQYLSPADHRRMKPSNQGYIPGYIHLFQLSRRENDGYQKSRIFSDEWRREPGRSDESLRGLQCQSYEHGLTIHTFHQKNPANPDIPGQHHDSKQHEDQGWMRQEQSGSISLFPVPDYLDYPKIQSHQSRSGYCKQFLVLEGGIE
ncbi:MAG: hypothetical protein BWY45_00187 [Euryarchaeota archaeon ADurb.Bin294]|nr:MAG: hypothetical protein BWY45_00187 [Euryarchaeota archaeon ADurb.Bin294]